MVDVTGGGFLKPSNQSRPRRVPISIHVLVPKATNNEQQRITSRFWYSVILYAVCCML